MDIQEEDLMHTSMYEALAAHLEESMELRVSAYEAYRLAFHINEFFDNEEAAIEF